MNDKAETPHRMRGFCLINQLTEAIIGGAIEVHRHLGPGLLENAYEVALCRELQLRRIPLLR